MPRVQEFKKITKHFFPNKELYTAAMERGLIKEGDEVFIGGNESEEAVPVDYNSLDNLPTINGATVVGDMKSEDLNLQDAMIEVSPTEVIDMWNRIMNEE